MTVLPNDLLIAKLEAYGHDKPSLNLVNDYLSFRKQRTKKMALHIVPGLILLGVFPMNLF